MTRSALSLPVDTEAVARAVAARVPAVVPLVAVLAADDERPAPEALAVVASVVGARGATFALVAEAVVAELTTTGVAVDTPIAVADALRPALDAAVGALGSGVLEGLRTESAEAALTDDMTVYALQADGATVAWFGVRVTETRVPGSRSKPATCVAVVTARRFTRNGSSMRSISSMASARSLASARSAACTSGCAARK